MLDGCASDDETVKLLVFDLLERHIEFFHVFSGGILGAVFGHTDQRKFDLQRRRTSQARKLVLCLDLLGHEIQ